VLKGKMLTSAALLRAVDSNTINNEPNLIITFITQNI